MWLRKMVRAMVGLLGAILLASGSWAQERNGNWWLTLPTRDRPIYMIGFFDGMEFQLDRATDALINPWQADSFPATCDAACVSLRVDQSFTNWKNLQKGYKDFDNVTAGQMVAGVDAMYSDFRNRTLSVKEILAVVIWSIKGGDQKAIDARLTFLRSQK